MENTLRVKFLFVLLPLLSAFFIGCASEEKKSDQAEGAFAIAKEFEDAERYEEAIRRYQEVKNKFPYSQFATKAELSIADCYFKQESFAEAQVSYQGFRDLHPKHPQMDYVIFRIGMSYFNQLPPTIDRDLTYAKDAINYFNELINKYPNSEFAKEARDNKAKAIHNLAEKEQYIADFYFKKKQYDSALSRYEGLLKQYPDQGLNEHALARSAFCADRLNQKDKFSKYSDELKSKFPQSELLSQLQKEVD